MEGRELVPLAKKPKPKRMKNAPKQSPVAFIPDGMWERMLGNAAMATERLARILASPSFNKLPIRDQTALIKLAHEQAFGVAATAKQKIVVVDHDSDGSGNALRSLANKATVLPEFAKSADKNRAN